MDEPVDARPASASRIPGVMIPAVIGLIYALGHFTWFSETPLGKVPVLDQREVLNLANAIANGTVPAEPFYRAPGYPLALAALRWLGIAPAGLFSAALLLGAILHGLNTLLVTAIAGRWFDRRTGIVAGILYGLYPIAVHFAVQAGDATPALNLFLLALWLAPLVRTPASAAPAGWRWAGASLSLAAATFFRPNYLLVWLVLPLLAARHTPRPRAIACSCAGIAIFAAAALWQWNVCGEAGFLPAQGAYNLWAANQPGAHGRYYAQKLSLPAQLAEQNPARAESILLYQRETGATRPDLAGANRYWRTRFWTYVTQHPLAWAAQLGRKFYALLNDWEQYNNETPAFHLHRSPWLRLNPLSWGFLLVFATAGCFRLAARREEDGAAGLGTAVIALVIACAASAVLFFVSARFRLPLVPLVTILAAAALAYPGFWRAWSPRRRYVLLAACVAAAAVTFSTFDHVRDTATVVQDHALLARAAASTGDDQLAFTEAEAALAMRPDHPDALRIAVASYFNQLLDGSAQPRDEQAWQAAAVQLLASIGDAPDLRAIAAVALWRAGQKDQALTEWRRLDGVAGARSARFLVGDLPDFQAERFDATARHEPLVQMAQAKAGRAKDRDYLATVARRVFER